MAKKGKGPGQPGANSWLDCFVECVNRHGWENAAICAFLCSIEFPDGFRESGLPQPLRPQQKPPPDGFLPLKGCRGFHENISNQPQTITVTIYNPGPGNMDVNLQMPNGNLDGTPLTTVEEGEYKTITVTIPPKRRLHANNDGSRKLENAG